MTKSQIVIVILLSFLVKGTSSSAENMRMKKRGKTLDEIKIERHNNKIVESAAIINEMERVSRKHQKSVDEFLEYLYPGESAALEKQDKEDESVNNIFEMGGQTLAGMRLVYEGRVMMTRIFIKMYIENHNVPEDEQQIVGAYLAYTFRHRSRELLRLVQQKLSYDWVANLFEGFKDKFKYANGSPLMFIPFVKKYVEAGGSKEISEEIIKSAMRTDPTVFTLLNSWQLCHADDPTVVFKDIASCELAKLSAEMENYQMSLSEESLLTAENQLLNLNLILTSKEMFFERLETLIEVANHEQQLAISQILISLVDLILKVFDPTGLSAIAINPGLSLLCQQIVPRMLNYLGKLGDSPETKERIQLIHNKLLLATSQTGVVGAIAASSLPVASNLGDLNTHLGGPHEIFKPIDQTMIIFDFLNVLNSLHNWVRANSQRDMLLDYHDELDVFVDNMIQSSEKLSKALADLRVARINAVEGEEKSYIELSTERVVTNPVLIKWIKKLHEIIIKQYKRRGIVFDRIRMSKKLRIKKYKSSSKTKMINKITYMR